MIDNKNISESLEHKISNDEFKTKEDHVNGEMNFIEYKITGSDSHSYELKIFLKQKTISFHLKK